MIEYKAAVYIGRFQPFHNGHVEIIKKGLEIADKVVVVVGSINAAPNMKNPFSFEERRQMILDGMGSSRVEVVGVRDYFYSDNTWVAEIQSQTSKFFDTSDSVALLGEYKDVSSYYIKYFPQWDFIPFSANHMSRGINSTDIRNSLFKEDIKNDWEGKPSEKSVNWMEPIIVNLSVPKTTKTFLSRWIKNPIFTDISDEWRFIHKYKKDWEPAPFAPTFNTVDAVVVCSGHVLVVKRGMNPGKGLYAIPGGFLKQTERIKDGAIRELREETKIGVDKIILESQIVADKVFDHPDRSNRGRTITHAFYIRLKDGVLPSIKASDDAAEALWMPLNEVAKNENKFFDDHAHIIHYFTTNS